LKHHCLNILTLASKEKKQGKAESQNAFNHWPPDGHRGESRETARVDLQSFTPESALIVTMTHGPWPLPKFQVTQAAWPIMTHQGPLVKG
jgi:hypothetical protein